MKKFLAIFVLLCVPLFAQEATFSGGVKFAGGVATTQAAFNFAIASTQLPSGTYNVAYTPFQLQTTGGVGAVTCTFLSGPLDLPTGMAFTNSTCTLSGTPTQVGTFRFLFQANDSGGNQAQARVQFSIACTALQMNTPVAFPPADKNTAWSYQISTLGGIAPLTFGSSGLPTGLSINSSTGLISGTPTAAGNFTPSVTVTDSCPTAQSVSGSFTEAVNNALVVTTNVVPNGIVGHPFSAQLASAGGTAPVSWSVDTLPTGLSLNSSSGSVSGTPTAVQNITSTFTVTDAIAATASATFSISTACTPLVINTTTLPDGTQNVAYQIGVSVTGGSGTLTYSASGLPTGLSINSSTGLISGTPSVAGTYNPTASVTDSCATAQTATTSYTINIVANAGALTITTPSLPPAIEGAAYGPISMTANGGVTPYTWSLLAGSFPTGITMTSGVISGTPTSAGTSNPDIKVTDNVATTAHAVFPITVSCATLTNTSTALPPATQGTSYLFVLVDTGGNGSVSWTATGMPTGLNVGLATGIISGIPSVNGTFTPTITATDSCSPTPQAVSVTYSLQVNAAALAILTPSLPNGTVNQPYSATLVGTGGTAPYTWSSTALPTGLSLNASTGVISGTPTVAGSTSVTVTLTDNASHTVTHAYTIVTSVATAADNTYCSPSGTWLGATTDGPASLPVNCYYTALSGTPSNGTVRGPVSSLSALNTAYAAAVCGDVIQITAGASITGPWTPAPKHCPDTAYITIESTGISNGGFPAEGTRLTPCTSGVAALPNRPTYPCPTPTVLTAQFIAPASNNAITMNGTDHIRFIGIEITRPTAARTIIFNLVDLGSVNNTGVQTNHIIFDRVWMHGVNADGTFPQTTTTDTSTTRAIYLAQSNHIGVIDSYFSDFYDNGSTSSNGNSDAQCIGGGAGGVANSGWGVYKFVNNHCEASGEGILLGGSSGPPRTPSGCTVMVNCNLDVPTDIEVRRNYFFKPLSWNGNTTSVNTVGWPVEKNGFEMKIGARALFEANVIENTWYSAQVGWCWSTAPKNQSGSSGLNGTAPTALTNDFTYRYNYCYNVAYGIGLYQSMDNGCTSCQAQGATDISIHDNLLDDNLNLGSLAAISAGDGASFTAEADSTASGLNQINNVSFVHNTLVKAVRASFGFGANASGQLHTWTFQNNIFPYGNFGVIANPSTGGCVSTADNSNKFNLLLTGCVTTFTADHNALFGEPGTLGVNWPTNGSGLGNWFFTSPTATANYLNSAGATVSGSLGFSNFSTNSGFNPSNFSLTGSSPLHNAGSDGKDLGADINTLGQKIAGVRQ